VPPIALSIVVLFSFALNVNAQVTQSTSQQVPQGIPVPFTPAPKDPQAVSVLNQAVTVAGGIQAIFAINDYTASGNIAYAANQDMQGSVTLSGRLWGQFRMDESLPTGVRSQAISDGQTSTKDENGTVQHPRVQAPLNPSSLALPYLLLRVALQNPTYNLTYDGVAEIDGHSTHHIQVQRALAGGSDTQGVAVSFGTRDFFVDVSSFQVIMTQDSGKKGAVRQLHYSNYTSMNGILVPFLISEQWNGQPPTWVIQLKDIAFNSGLQDSAFQF